MAEEHRVIELEITVKERTNYGILGKTFSDSRMKDKRAAAIVELIEYLAGHFQDDFFKALKILKEKRTTR
jgi:hypothetical protein